MTNKLRAVKKGIKKTPSAIIDGKKYEETKEILEALQTISSKLNV
ncbi:MAG: hypothetical protein ACP5IM_03300 [Candidatus Bathyarchaeia archaeon]